MAVPAASRVLLRSLLGIVLLVSAAFLMSEHMCAWRREPFAASGTGDYFDTGVDNGRPVIPSRSSRSSPASSPSPSPPPTRMSSLAAEQSRSHVQYEEHPRAARPGVRIIRPGELPQPANKDAPPAAPSPPSPPAVPSVEDDDDAAESNDDNAPEEPDSAVGDAAERGAGGEEVVIEPLPAECNGTLSEAQLQQGAQSGLTAARRRWAREAAATRAHIVLPEQVSQDKAYANEVQEVQDAGVDDDVVVVGPAWDSCMPSGCWRGASRSAVELQPECALAGEAVSQAHPPTAPVFTHVLNPFPNKGGDPQYNWTLQAIVEAVQYAKAHGIEVEVLAAHFTNEDMDLPGYHYGRGKYIVFTNYDIILRRDFYTTLFKMYNNDPKMRVIDNLRRDMVISAAGIIDHWTVHDIFSWPKLKSHPGHDCLIVPRSWVPCLRFDDFMLGMGYWGTMVVRELKHLTTALGLHQLVDTLHLTRHLGHRTQLGERWLGAGKDWRESHAQQVKHNYWQYTKVTYGVRNEEARFAEMLRAGKIANYSATDIPAYLDRAELIIGQIATSLPSKCRELSRPKPMTLHRSSPPPALWTLPGVDDVTVQRFIETLTGYELGSAYVGPETIPPLPGRDRCGAEVVAVHVHGERHPAIELLDSQFVGGCHKCRGLFAGRQRGFERVLAVVDTPVEALYTAFHQKRRRSSVGPGAMPALDLSADDKKAYAAALAGLTREQAFALAQLAALRKQLGDELYIITADKLLTANETVLQLVLGHLDVAGQHDRSVCASLMATVVPEALQYMQLLLHSPVQDGQLTLPKPSDLVKRPERAAIAAAAREIFAHTAASCAAWDILSVQWHNVLPKIERPQCIGRP